MATVRDLRDRIKSLKNTQQITKAMKQVAAAKIRRAEIAQKQARPYADTLSEMLRDLMRAVSSVDHPFMKPGKAGAPVGILLMTADKGLAGAFNSNVIRAAEIAARERGSVSWYTVGIKARNAVRRLGQTDRPNWTLNAPSKLATAREVAQRVTADFTNGTISEIVLASSKLVSMLSQKPEIRKLVPFEISLSPSERSERSPERGEAESKGESKGTVEFAGSPEFVLSRLLPKYLEFTIFSAMLETDAAFFAAQLVAMNNATDNAGKLIDEFTIQMNNARQAAITKELLEIVAGAEALAG
ncbi:MAG TPA: ATP synthase F1 subunit gamma [Candidatus Baltobacteraceae bacterium]|nr:ATP synthase F1 subunit gamma [Candidatus Baltobacteraceae bacterium]